MGNDSKFKLGGGGLKGVNTLQTAINKRLGSTKLDKPNFNLEIEYPPSILEMSDFIEEHKATDTYKDDLSIDNQIYRKGEFSVIPKEIMDKMTPELMDELERKSMETGKQWAWYSNNPLSPEWTYDSKRDRWSHTREDGSKGHMSNERRNWYLNSASTLLKSIDNLSTASPYTNSPLYDPYYDLDKAIKIYNKIATDESKDINKPINGRDPMTTVMSNILSNNTYRDARARRAATEYLNNLDMDEERKKLFLEGLEAHMSGNEQGHDLLQKGMIGTTVLGALLPFAINGAGAASTAASVKFASLPVETQMLLHGLDSGLKIKYGFDIARNLSNKETNPFIQSYRGFKNGDNFTGTMNALGGLIDISAIYNPFFRKAKPQLLSNYILGEAPVSMKRRFFSSEPFKHGFLTESIFDTNRRLGKSFKGLTLSVVEGVRSYKNPILGYQYGRLALRNSGLILQAPEIGTHLWFGAYPALTGEPENVQP